MFSVEFKLQNVFLMNFENSKLSSKIRSLIINKKFVKILRKEDLNQQI